MAIELRGDTVIVVQDLVDYAPGESILIVATTTS